MVRARCTLVVVQASQKGIVTATETKPTPLEFAVDRAQQTQTWMAFATTSTNVLVHSTHATCATAQAKSSSVAAPTSPLEIAIVMKTNSTLWACVAGTAMRTRMLTAFVTTSTIASGS